MKATKAIFTAIVLMEAVIRTAAAQPADQGICNSNLSCGLGYSEMDTKDPYASYQINYIAPSRFRAMHPLVGGLFNFRSDYYIYGGIAIPLVVNKFSNLCLSFAAGLYSVGEGKAPGYPLEFRTGIQFSFKLTKKTYLGIEYFHISNAGLGDTNTGIETIMVNLQFPMGSINNHRDQ